MKETVKSLGGYLMFIGVIGVIGCLLYLLDPPFGEHSLSHLIGLAYCAWSAFALYIGAKLKTLLIKNPQLPFRYCYANIALAVLTFSLFQIIFSVLFNGYVINQLRRLAREETDVLEKQVLS